MIFFVNIQYGCFVELLGVLTMILAQKRLLRKKFQKFLLPMNSASKMQNLKKGKVHRLVSGQGHITERILYSINFWLTRHKIPHESINFIVLYNFILFYYVIKSHNQLIVSLQMKTGNVPDPCDNISISIGPQYVMDHNIIFCKCRYHS